jgi:DnaJ-class molecular chaperone
MTFLVACACSTGGGGQDFDMSDFGFGDGGGFGSFGDPFKIFEEHFGGSFGGSFGGGSFGGGGSSRRSMRESASRHPPVQKPLPCTLEELYVRIISTYTFSQFLGEICKSVLALFPVILFRAPSLSS